jgi:hypothetical protein
VAFAGDTAGVSIDGGYVLPPTPPPDIDPELWAASVARIGHWSPSTLFMTHFGPAASVRPHLHALLAHLDTISRLARESLDGPGTDEDRHARFLDALRLELRREMSEAQALVYEAASPLGLMWFGLARYWRKRGAT